MCQILELIEIRYIIVTNRSSLNQTSFASSCLVDVIVEDDEAPSIACPDPEMRIMFGEQGLNYRNVRYTGNEARQDIDENGFIAAHLLQIATATDSSGDLAFVTSSLGRKVFLN